MSVCHLTPSKQVGISLKSCKFQWGLFRS